MVARLSAEVSEKLTATVHSRIAVGDVRISQSSRRHVRANTGGAVHGAPSFLRIDGGSRERTNRRRPDGRRLTALRPGTQEEKSPDSTHPAIWLKTRR